MITAMTTNATTASVDTTGGNAKTAKTVFKAHQSTATTTIKTINATNLFIYSPPYLDHTIPATITKIITATDHFPT